MRLTGGDPGLTDLALDLQTHFPVPLTIGGARMKRILALLLTFCCLASAKEQAVHWSDLAPLITGKEVVVRLQNGKRVKGRMVTVGADSLTVETSAGQRSIARSSLQEIRLPKKAGYKWRILGTAMGAGAGVAVSVPLLRYAHNEGSSTYNGVAAGLIVGLAALGYLGGWSADRSGDVIRVLPD